MARSVWLGFVLLGCLSILPEPADAEAANSYYFKKEDPPGKGSNDNSHCAREGKFGCGYFKKCVHKDFVCDGVWDCFLDGWDEKDCEDNQCPQTGINTQGRENVKIIHNVKSWGDCALHCYKEDNCKFWTWHHSGAGRWAFECNLMSGYSRTSSDSNCVTGKKDCQETNKSGDCVDSVRSYKGSISTTESGRTCQNWNDQKPHSHGVHDKGSSRFRNYWQSLGQTSAEAKNYCRDPDNSARLWCYTKDSGKRWEYCSVPKCGQENSGDVDCLFGHDSATSKNPDDQRTALHFAAKWNYLSCVSKLVADGAEVDAMGTRKQTPLSLAAEEGHCDVMKKLVDLGADVYSVLDPDNGRDMRKAATMIKCGIEVACVEDGIEYVPEADDDWNNRYLLGIIDGAADCANRCIKFNERNLSNGSSGGCGRWTFFRGSDVFENKCKIMEKTYKRVVNPAATSGGESCRP